MAAGDSETGVTIMRVRPARFDTGEVLAKRGVEVGEEEGRRELTARLAVMGAQLLLQVLRSLEEHLEQAEEQEEEGVTKAPLVTTAMACLDFSKLDATQVFNLWRALGDVKKLRAKYEVSGVGGVEVRLATCHPPSTLASTSRLDPLAPPGSLQHLKLGKGRSFLCVRCREGWVAFTGILYGNKKEMSPRDFYNGYLSKPGLHRFVTCDPPSNSRNPGG